jgi:outer membrane protein assembly factor BamB
MWRGPLHDGLCRETKLLRQWPAEGPQLLWKVDGVGQGYSTPSIAGDLLFVMGNRDGQEWVFALDRTQQGRQRWAAPVGPIRHEGAGYPGPRGTPTVDGNRVFAIGINGDLVALDAATGKLVWRHDLVGQFGGSIPNWGYCESPLIDGDRLICTPGGAKATLAALDKHTGRVQWMAPVGDPAGYASPIPAVIDGVRQYLQFTAQGLIAVAAEDGRFLWRYDAPANGTANIATPLAFDNMAFAASGYGTGGGLVQLTRRGQQFDPREVYFSRDIKNHHGGLILLDGYIYGANDPGLLTCLDAKTGKVMWTNRSPGKCSLLYVDGMLIARSEEGRVSLVAADPDGFQLLGQFEQPLRSELPSWPHPVVAGGRLYLRDQNTLLCYDVRGDGR